MTILTRHINIIHVVFFTCLLFVVSCNGSPASQSHTDYDKLCQIYEGVVKQPIEVRMKEVKLLERVQKELPDFFNDNFVHITKAKPSMRYQFIKQLAEEETKGKWDCEVMRSYYNDAFK